VVVGTGAVILTAPASIPAAIVTAGVAGYSAHTAIEGYGQVASAKKGSDVAVGTVKVAFGVAGGPILKGGANVVGAGAGWVAERVGLAGVGTKLGGLA